MLFDHSACKFENIAPSELASVFEEFDTYRIHRFVAYVLLEPNLLVETLLVYIDRP
jgi:hypothetical protein